jgi:hypothetical protein
MQNQGERIKGAHAVEGGGQDGGITIALAEDLRRKIEYVRNPGSRQLAIPNPSQREWD